MWGGQVPRDSQGHSHGVPGGGVGTTQESPAAVVMSYLIVSLQVPGALQRSRAKDHEAGAGRCHHVAGLRECSRLSGREISRLSLG